MNVSRHRQLLRRVSQRIRPYLALTAAGFLTVASNANALVLPNLPLEIGAAYPPPNVMFILDVSGSMDDTSMPDTVPSVSPVNFNTQTYARNTIYYNPATTYQPWMTWDGTRDVQSPAVSYTNALSSLTLADDNVTNLSTSDKDYYVLKTSTSNAAQTTSYYRYTIVEADAATTALRGRVVQSEYVTRPTRAITDTAYDLFDKSGLAAARNTWVNGTTGTTAPTLIAAGENAYVELPAAGTLPLYGAITELKFELTGTDSDANLYVRQSGSNAPTTNSAYRCPGSDSDSNEVCTQTGGSIAPGQRWYFGVRAADSSSSSSFANVRLKISYNVRVTPPYDPECPNQTSDPGWYNCTFATPPYVNTSGATVNRTEAQEKENFAIWYSYHRTRMKVAKAGASEAFHGLPSSLRIGYTDIRNGDDGDSSTPNNRFPIPVGTEDGLFQNDNKETWFSRLHNARASGNTPLRTGLISVGEYYKDTAATGPWGPEATSAQLSCRQNFAILTTDGYWNRGLESSNSAANTILTSTIGNEDQTAGTPYQDARSDTLADIAMHYWKNDLRPLMPNNVPASTSNPASYQHMVTFGISLGLQGTIAPANVPNPGDAWVTPSTGWPNPIPAGSDGDTTAGPAAIDDLLHAAVNSRGQFVVVNNAAEFQRGLLDAFTLVAQRTASSSGAASNSTQFTDNTRAFLARFTSGVWSGELSGFRVTPGAVTPIWQAAAQVRAAVTAGTRTFFTWNGTAGATFPTSGQTSALDRSSGYIPAVTGAQNVAYLKGDSSLERRRSGGFLRNRVNADGDNMPLGDIVHSVPAYAKDTQVVYVGANDGMLHAFNEVTGAELFTYVPGILNFGELAAYSSPDYRHSFFVDGPVVITTLEQTPGTNYLIGALGHGGRGLYGLNVSTPTSFSASNVLWEISAADEPNIGNVLGTPLIATLQDDSKVVIVGNGPNSDSGNAVLLIIDVATGDVTSIDTGVGGDNGLSAPRGADFDGDKKVDVVYAGDLKGNLWKFDFTGTAPELALDGDPLFTAQTGQAFSADLALAADPETGKTWVFAGSGRYITNGDVADETVQSVYGIIDNDTPVAALAGTTDDELQQRTITVVTTEDDDGVVFDVRGFEANDPLDPDKRGWYLNLDEPDEGERITTPLLVQQNVLTFLSRTPPFDTDPCNTGGSGWANSLDAFTGSSTTDPYFNVGDGMINPSDPDADPTLPIGSLGLGHMPTGTFIIGDYMYISDTSGNFSIIPINPPTGTPRRSSWHEITSD